MSLRRYIAHTSREAMAQVRRELGEDAVILSSRRVADGFEIVAAAPQVMDRLVERVSTRAAPSTIQSPPKAAPERRPEHRSEVAVAQIRPDESFQEFVRRQTQSPSQSGARQGASRPSSATSSAARAPTDRRSVPNASKRYQEVARAPEPVEESEDDLWKPTTFLLPTQTTSPSAPKAYTPRHVATKPDAAPTSAQGQQTLSASLSMPNGSGMGASNRLPTRWLSSEGSVPEVPPPAVFHRRSESRVAPRAAQTNPQAAHPPQTQKVPPAQAAEVHPVLQPAPQPMAPLPASQSVAQDAAPQPVVQPPVLQQPVVQQPVVQQPVVQQPVPQAVADTAPAPQQAAPQPAVQPQPAAAPQQAVAAAQPPVATVSAPAAGPSAEQKLLKELMAMRAQLQRQIESLSTTVAADRQQLQSQLTNSLMQLQAAAQRNSQSLPARVMTRLLTSGYSPEVARKVALHVPQALALPEAETWLQDVLALNLKVIDPAHSMTEAGGAYALVGPTGVGKTTTVAKLAAQFAVKYGSGALGLITLDAYRLGAHEQLRSFGRILGAPVHLVQDSGTLRELLVSMQNKRLVLIDTCGVSQRDGRLNELLSMIATASQGAPEAMRIQRVLLTNAASHAETLDETARAWRASECAGCVLTKLDEAVRIGGALDAALRHKLRLYGVTNGQRVPEDWHAANARVLAHLSLKPGADAFVLAENEALALTGDTHAAGFDPMAHSF